FAGHNDAQHRVPQRPGSTMGPRHTFLQINTDTNNQPLNISFDWLVHLDRQLVSPMELMNVAALRPHLLTQEFLNPTAGAGHITPHNHVVPWYDQNEINQNRSHRFYRFLEFVATRSRAAGLQAPTTLGHIVPGTPVPNSQIRVDRLSWVTPSGGL